MYVGCLEFVHVNAGGRGGQKHQNPGAGVIGGCDPQDMGVETKFRSSVSAVHTLN